MDASASANSSALVREDISGKSSAKEKQAKNLVFTTVLHGFGSSGLARAPQKWPEKDSAYL